MVALKIEWGKLLSCQAHGSCKCWLCPSLQIFICKMGRSSEVSVLFYPGLISYFLWGKGRDQSPGWSSSGEEIWYSELLLVETLNHFSHLALLYTLAISSWYPNSWAILRCCGTEWSATWWFSQLQVTCHLSVCFPSSKRLILSYIKYISCHIFFVVPIFTALLSVFQGFWG